MENLKENLSHTYALFMLILTYIYFIPRSMITMITAFCMVASCKFTLQEAILWSCIVGINIIARVSSFLIWVTLHILVLEIMPKKKLRKLFITYLSELQKTNKQTNKQKQRYNLHKRFAKSNWLYDDVSN